jgi:hypothetical protein
MSVSSLRPAFRTGTHVRVPGMIKTIRIQNFKSLGDVTVHLDPVTVLIGRSGTGKSNFVQAIRLLRDVLQSRNETPIQAEGGWPRVFCAVALPKADFGFEVTFRHKGLPADFEYRLRWERPQKNAAPGFAEERLALGKTILFHHQGGKWIEPPKVPLPPPQPSAVMLGAITGSQEITVAYLLLTTGIGCYDFPGSVLLEGSNPSHVTGLADTGSNYLQAFIALVNDLNALPAWTEIKAALRKINPSVDGLDLVMPERNSIAIRHRFGNSDLLHLGLGQESEGLRRFLAHLLALYQTPPKQTLVFEEPEKGIHPGALATLAEEFRACPAAGRGRVILTTHSPQLLDHFAPDALRVVEIKDGLTQIGPVSLEQKEALQEQLLLPGELLTVDPARLPDMLTPVN